MITWKEQETIFVEISKRLKKRITVYAVGGNAMIYWGHKDATVDVDLVFTSEADRKAFVSALESMEFVLTDSSLVYGRKDNQPIMLRRTDQERFDLFLNKIIRFDLSDDMKKRAEKTFEYASNLVIKIADYHDIILMKCATERAKDKEDIKTIIESEKIDWDIIVKESKNQVELGNGGTVFNLIGECLEMVEKMKLNIPPSFFNKMWDIFSEEISLKRGHSADKNETNNA